MDKNHADLVKERLQLQQSLREHFEKEGFDYRDYVSPPADSWVAQYKQRIKEIDAILAPELQYWQG